MPRRDVVVVTAWVPPAHEAQSRGVPVQNRPSGCTSLFSSRPVCEETVIPISRTVSGPQQIPRASAKQRLSLSAPRDQAEREAIIARSRERYEQALRLNRRDLRQWMRYAQIEIDAHNIDRARSVFERAIAVDHTYVPLWLRYGQMEILAHQFEHARALYDRSVTLLPFENKLWLSYIEMEELLDNTESARLLLKRWTTAASKPGDSIAWTIWLTFEKHNQGDVLSVLESWISRDPGNVTPWLRLANETDPRSAYSQAVDSNMLSDSGLKEVLVKWASYERALGEQTRADRLLSMAGTYSQQPDAEAHATFTGVESWWIEINDQTERGAESDALLDLFRTAVDRALPPSTPLKTAEWRKYALLWLRYAIFAERHGSSTGEIYEDALSKWPHATFTSRTLWKAYADFQIRHDRLDAARKILGSALGKTGGHFQLFRDYITLEKKLLATRKVRALYEKLCEKFPHVSEAWIDSANFEMSLSESVRARWIFEAALSEPKLDSVDSVWIARAEAEADAGNFDVARSVWERAVTSSLDDIAGAWAQYAMFEVSTGLDDESDSVDPEAEARARAVFNSAFAQLKDNCLARLNLYDLFMQFEEAYGTDETLSNLRNRAPRAVTKRNDDGEEYDELVFDEPQPASALSKLMANAQKWKSANAEQH